ncbi:MAG TPA: OmpH family outer membrane protein [Balneolaceae bacterium]|nr:OmpH family outer membrane protein [Balneolaceae bacterium]
MSYCKIYPFTFALLFLVTSAVTAQQNQKFGYIDSDFVLERMPEYSGIEQRLNILSEAWRDELREMNNEIRELEEDFETREILYTEDIRQEKLNEIEAKKRERDTYTEQKFGPDGEYFQQQKELLEPIQRKIFDAVNKIAIRDGYDFVFDRSEDFRILYARTEWNLTEEVLLELGIDVNRLGN